MSVAAEDTVVLHNVSTTVTETASAPFGSAEVRFDNGILSLQPVLAAGESWDGSLGAISLTNGAANRLSISRGSGSSATVTLGGIAHDNLKPLVITAGGGTGSLGENEKVLVAGKAAAGGTPVFVTRSIGVENSPFSMLGYDTAKGFYPIDYSSVETLRAAGGVDGSFASVQVPRPAWKLSTDGEGVLLETNVGLAILVR